jgi:putative glutamine amidotransferase
MKRVAVTYSNEKKVVPYADALRAAGVDPVLLRAGAAASLSDVDGLLVSGGTDLAPALYGQPPDPRTGSPDVERDEMERRLLLQALSAGTPVLAICRGMQLFNVVHGGTLAQHVEGHEMRPPDASAAAHKVSIQPGSLLYRILGASEVQVNSRHHQTVDRVGEALVATAWSKDDRVVEGMERPDLRFAVAVQWHPEDLVSRYPEQLRLFEALRDSL